MKPLLVSVLLLAAVASTPAFAAQMQFNAPVGGNYYGVATYPYDFSVNGHDAWLMCVSYNEHIVGGETWQATVLPITGLHNEQLAWLFLQAKQVAVTNPQLAADYNAAAWSLNEGVPGLDVPTQGIYNTIPTSFTPGEFNNVVMYVPIPGTESWAGETPQTFLGAVPEPGSLLLMGSGILGAAGMLRRKLA